MTLGVIEVMEMWKLDAELLELVKGLLLQNTFFEKN